MKVAIEVKAKMGEQVLVDGVDHVDTVDALDGGIMWTAVDKVGRMGLEIDSTRAEAPSSNRKGGLCNRLFKDQSIW